MDLKWKLKVSLRNSSKRQVGAEMERCCGLVEMAFEQVAASLKRVCLLQALTGRQLGQTLEQRWPGDDLTRDRAHPARAAQSGLACLACLAAAHGATGSSGNASRRCMLPCAVPCR